MERIYFEDQIFTFIYQMQLYVSSFECCRLILFFVFIVIVSHSAFQYFPLVERRSGHVYSTLYREKNWSETNFGFTFFLLKSVKLNTNTKYQNKKLYTKKPWANCNCKIYAPSLVIGNFSHSGEIYSNRFVVLLQC